MTSQESELPVIARVASSTSEAAVTMEMFYKMTSVGEFSPCSWKAHRFEALTDSGADHCNSLFV